MNNIWLLIGHRFSQVSVLVLLAASAALLLWVSPSEGAGLSPNGYPVLASCSGSTLVFPPGFAIVLTDSVERLKANYHTTVREIVEAHIDHRTVACSEGVWDVPTPKLSSLASKLPPWRKPADHGGLRESDIGAVLLEYLRIYECTLKEHQYFAAPRTAQESVAGGTSLFPHFVLFTERLENVRKELLFTRRALNRVLEIIGGMDRLRPVDVSLECLQRSSLDIRNVLGLAADSVSCLPRTWDTRGSLRDLPAP